MTQMTNSWSLIKAYLLGFLSQEIIDSVRKNNMKTKDCQSKDLQSQESSQDIISLSPIEEDILSVLYPNKELYGLSIINTIEKVGKGRRKIGANTLYPTLRRMESVEKGYITSRWGDERPEELVERGGARRRYYKLTDKGQNALEATWEYREKLLGINFSQTLLPSSS